MALIEAIQADMADKKDKVIWIAKIKIIIDGRLASKTEKLVVEKNINLNKIGP